jgi:TolB protein
MSRLSRTPRALARFIAFGTTLAALALGACTEDAPPVSPAEPLAVDAAFGKGPSGNSRPILFMSDAETEHGQYQIYALDPDTRGVTRVAQTSTSDFYPTWSPDAKSIIYSASLPTLGSIIYRMNANGTGIVPLTDGTAWNIATSWSKDNRIAFASSRHAKDPTATSGDSLDVYVMDASGNNVTRLTTNSRYDGLPSWSPDARRIAFVSSRDSKADTSTVDIYVMNADGSNVRRLTTRDFYAIPRLGWSPDGRTVVFAATPNASAVDLFVVRVEDRQLTQLTFDGNSSMPAWSPDGNLIVFAKGVGTTGGSDLFTMRADGTGVSPLTVSPNVTEFFPAWYR